MCVLKTICAETRFSLLVVAAAVPSRAFSRPLLIAEEHVGRHVGEQLVDYPLEDGRQLRAQLRHHHLQHFLPVFPQEQVRCFHWKTKKNRGTRTRLVRCSDGGGDPRPQANRAGLPKGREPTANRM